MKSFLPLVMVAMGFLTAAWSAAAETPKTTVPAALTYRTAGGDQSLPWYFPRPGEFPPPDTARLITARLIPTDVLNRRGRLAPDTLPGNPEYRHMFPDFALLPYARIFHHGAPAEFRDLPPDAHLYVQAYRDDGDKDKPYQVLIIEDDFSHFQHQRKTYHIDEVKTSAGRIKVSVQGGDAATRPVELMQQEAFPIPTFFDDPKQRPYELAIDADTRVWKGRGIGSLSDLAAGQDVQINLAGSTPFRDGTLQALCTEIWIDQDARTLTTEFQRGKFIAWIKRHGFPARVDSAQGKTEVTLTMFWPIELFTAKGEIIERDFVVGKNLKVEVAEDSLRVYYQNAMGCAITTVRPIPAEVGSGGLQIVVRPQIMLEGFRPGKIIRVFPESWPAHQLPPGEGYHPLLSP